MEAYINDIIKHYTEKVHHTMGVLLTPDTQRAWANLRQHVLQGCLCDPPGIEMNIVSAEDEVSIGGENFKQIHTVRGVSSLEGFHYHQKEWLGENSTHAEEAGLALVAEGVMRWNRKRNNEAHAASQRVPPVYADGLLNTINGIHQRLMGSSCYSEHQLADPSLTMPFVGHIRELSNHTGLD